MAGTTPTHSPPEQRPSTNPCAHGRCISRLLQTLNGLPCTNARSWEGCTSAPGFPAPCSASSQGLPSVPSLPLHPKPLLQPLVQASHLPWVPLCPHSVSQIALCCPVSSVPAVSTLTDSSQIPPAGSWIFPPLLPPSL